MHFIIRNTRKNPLWHCFSFRSYNIAIFIIPLTKQKGTVLPWQIIVKNEIFMSMKIFRTFLFSVLLSLSHLISVGHPSTFSSVQHIWCSGSYKSLIVRIRFSKTDLDLHFPPSLFIPGVWTLDDFSEGQI